MTRKSKLRWAATLGVVVALSVSVKILRWTGMACPFGKNLTAEAVEASRQRGMTALMGTKSAVKRPALGLVLASTTEPQAESWARAHLLECRREVRGMHFLSCKEPGKEATYTLAFNPAGKLVAVDLFRRKVSVESAESLLGSVADTLQNDLGPPHHKGGEFTRSYLYGGSEVKISFIEYRFRDYIAMVTASYLPWSGLTVHEQYSQVGTI